MNRFESKETSKELLSSLEYIFPITSTKELEKESVIKELELTKENREGGQYLFWSENYNGIFTVLYNHQALKEPVKGFLISVINKPQLTDLSFGNYYCKVFNDDIKIIPRQETHSEIWLSLRQTQFRRAIAKFSSFSTEPMIKWLLIVENSLSLRYENNPFSYCLFMTKQKDWIMQPLSEGFISFSEHIPFEKGIMSEKWLRGSMSGQTVGIAGYGLAGELFGMFAIPDKNLNVENKIISPHEDIEPITNLLVNGTCLFLTTVNGDIYFMLPNHSVFYKTQGRWFYVNYLNIRIVLQSLLSETVSEPLLRLLLNLAFDRQGALIFIPDNASELKEIIPDFDIRKKVNGTLRNTVNGLNISDKKQRKVIQSSAKVDGALIINNEGTVLDVACMIGQPTDAKLEQVGLEKLERFSGARSTAAWNASVYGTAIKVSEDGPISIFRQGKLIAQIG